jgi:hypothetical protein
MQFLSTYLAKQANLGTPVSKTASIQEAIAKMLVGGTVAGGLAGLQGKPDQKITGKGVATAAGIGAGLGLAAHGIQRGAKASRLAKLLKGVR